MRKQPSRAPQRSAYSMRSGVWFMCAHARPEAECAPHDGAYVPHTYARFVCVPTFVLAAMHVHTREMTWPQPSAARPEDPYESSHYIIIGQTIII